MNRSHTNSEKHPRGVTLAIALIYVAMCFAGLDSAKAQNPANALEAAGIVIPDNARMVVVEPDNFPASVGSLNETVEREIAVNPNTIFILKRDAVYWTLGFIENPDFRLHFRAEEGAGHPPIIRAAVDLGQGIYPIRSTGDVIMEGIYFIGINEEGGHEEHFYHVGSDAFLILDKCWITGAFANIMQTHGTGNKIYITNTLVYNSGRNEEDQNGRLIETRDNPQEIIYLENNTVYNMGHAFVRNSGGAVLGRLHINHNTVMNISQYIRAGGVQDMDIRNNIFRNVYTIGDYETELGRAWIEIQSQPAGMNEDLRNLQVRYNNMAYLDEEFFPLIEMRDAAKTGKISKAPNVSRRYMDPNNALPLVIYENNIEEKIDFEDPPTLENYLDWTEQWMKGRDGVPGPQPVERYNHPIAYDRWNDASHNPVPYHFTVDLVRDFTYSSDHESFTAAENSFPLGDLNWFPELRAMWIAGESPVSITESEAVVREFRLIGNYPNPFNPSTTIVYELATQAPVILEVFNVLGQSLLTMELGVQSAGRHQVTFDAGDLPSGMYIVRMGSGAHVQTHRITLMK